MPLLSPDFWEKIKQRVQSIGRGETYRWENPNKMDNSPINIPDYMEGVDARKYVEDRLSKPAQDVPQGGFGTRVESPKGSITWDYQDKAPFPEQYRGYLTESANQYGIDPNVLASLIASESGGAGYQTDLPGASGEVGMAQIIPQYFYQQAGFNSPDEYAQALKDPAFAIEQAAVILSDLLQQYNNNYYDALGAYNAGPTGYSQYGRGADYARDTLSRVGMLDQYGPNQLAGGY